MAPSEAFGRSDIPFACVARYVVKYQVPATWYGDINWDPPPSVAQPAPPSRGAGVFLPGARPGAAWGLCEAGAVENRRAVLSSASTSLEELVGRVVDVADDLRRAGDEGLAHDLYEVERALRTAQRRLGAVTRRLR